MRVVKGRGGRVEVVRASLDAGSRNGPGGGVAQSTSTLLGTDVKGSLLEGIIEEKSARQLQGVYRDIYLHDSIAGAAVDLKSSMPWSGFTLGGLDRKQEQVFEDNLGRLNTRSLHPELSVDQMVTGAFVGTLVYERKIKGFTDIIPFNYADCVLQDVPLYSTEPMIQLVVGKELKDFAALTSEEAKRIQSRIPKEMLDHFRSSKVVDLNPINTVYVPRTTMTSMQVGVSYYRRILPIWLLERVLYRGTISEATRRQRSTLHITAGDEEWIPNEDELQALVGLFQSSEVDPVSAVLATRNSIQTQEIRQGGDFWKWTDTIEQLAAMKMRALGINEAFLAGDASYNNMETALTVFMEELNTFRDRVSYQMYTSKLFPMISRLHGFKKGDRDGDGTHRRETAAYLQTINEALNDDAQLVIPEIKWKKQLGSQVDPAFLDILDRMEGHGLPVTLRMWGAAGGIDLDAAINELDADRTNRMKVLLAKKQLLDEANDAGITQLGTDAIDATGDFTFGIGQPGAPSGAPGGGGGGDGMEFSSLMSGGPEYRDFRSLSPAARILSRDYGDSSEVYTRTPTGKKQYVYRQARARIEQNNKIAKALHTITDPNVRKDALSRRAAYAAGLE